jgi:hypothetical protein
MHYKDALKRTPTLLRIQPHTASQECIDNVYSSFPDYLNTRRHASTPTLKAAAAEPLNRSSRRGGSRSVVHRWLSEASQKDVCSINLCLSMCLCSVRP